MKKIVLLFLTLFSLLETNASHLMGGQLTAKNIGGLTYEVTLTLYCDVLGIPLDSITEIQYQDSVGTVIDYHYVYYGSNVLNIGNGVEKYTFVDTITFNNVGLFYVSYSSCCRNASILNISSPANYGMTLDLLIFADYNNSSPVFLNEPITITQVNQPFNYNPIPYDSDGDSLSWVLDVPLDDAVIPIQVPGYFLPYSDSSSPFNLDQYTGEITFLPNTIGNFQISVKVIEWRNGIQIGYIRRDMQLIVIPSNNIPIQVLDNCLIQRTMSNPYTINVGQTMTFTINTFNNDNDPITVNCLGNSFLANNPPVIVLNNPYVSNGSVSSTTSVVEWTPTINEVSNHPYNLVFRVSDWHGNINFIHDYSYNIMVSNTTTDINENLFLNKKNLIRSIDLMGRDVDTYAGGFRINLYDDGSQEKVYILK